MHSDNKSLGLELWSVSETSSCTSQTWSWGKCQCEELNSPNSLFQWFTLLFHIQGVLVWFLAWRPAVL